MQPNDVQEYQQNEIDGAKDALEDRLEHVAGRTGMGILDARLLQEHQNKRAEAYLEGYADALEFAVREVKSIRNLVEYAEVTSEEPSPVLATLLRALWGANPQGPITELPIETVVKRAREHYDDEQVDQAIETAGYTEYFEEETDAPE